MIRSAPADKRGKWIETIRGKGWFVYFRFYGPEESAFNGSLAVRFCRTSI